LEQCDYRNVRRTNDPALKLVDKIQLQLAKKSDPGFVEELEG
jgi:hypothetical protein